MVCYVPRRDGGERKMRGGLRPPLLEKEMEDGVRPPFRLALVDHETWFIGPVLRRF